MKSHTLRSLALLAITLLIATPCFAQEPAEAGSKTKPNLTTEQTPTPAEASSEKQDTTDTAKPEATADKPEEASEAVATPEPIAISLDNGQMAFSATGTWEKVQPRSRIVQFEIKVPKQDTDERDGRLTIMGAGGSIEQNIDRWKGQFKQLNQSETTEKTISGQKVHLIDLSGNFMESAGGPFGPKTERENYRMLAAIIPTSERSAYFLKLYGPKNTIDKNAQHFKSLVESLKVAE